MRKTRRSVKEYVYVISAGGTLLMPTRRCAHIRRLLKEGKAKIINRNPLVIQLRYETPEKIQPLIMGIDPGFKTLAVVVRTVDGQVVYAGELELRTQEVTDNISKRRRYRRGRRGYRRLRRQRRYKKQKKVKKDEQVNGIELRKYRIKGIEKELVCKGIKPKLIKFENRKRPAGWSTPTARHLCDSHENFILMVEKMLPVSFSMLEYGQFDTHKLANPQVQGVEYQQGRMQGYANTREYVLYRDKHLCQLCKGDNRELHAHHVIWREHGGADTPENLVTLCRKCHTRTHNEPAVDNAVKKMFAQMPKRFVPASLLNNIMGHFYQWLSERFAQVKKVFGYQVKLLRQRHSLDKDHSLDAYLASLIGCEGGVAQWQDVVVYQYKQFRRHNRQLIHARRDRNYYHPQVKEGKKIIAKNRKARCGQVKDSLAVYREKKGEKEVGKLSVTAGKKMIRHKCKGHKVKKKDQKGPLAEEIKAAKAEERKKCKKCNIFRPGDIVMRKSGGVSVATGSGHDGYSVVLYGEKGYVPAASCKLLVRNTGVVCVNRKIVYGK